MKRLIGILFVLAILLGCDDRPILAGVFEVVSVHIKEGFSYPSSHIVIDDGQQRLYIPDYIDSGAPRGLFSLREGDIIRVQYKALKKGVGLPVIVDYEIVR